MLPIFTPTELEQNEVQKNKLADLIASTEAVLVVGAGSSASVGYGTWPTLISDLELLAKECGDDFAINKRIRQDDPLRYIDYVKRHVLQTTGNLSRYHARLRQLFRPDEKPPYNDLHVALVELPVRGILTTNYDVVLEAALAQKRREYAHVNSLILDERSPASVSEFFMAMNGEERIPRHVAHLHGRYDFPDTIVLSLEDYVGAYGLKLSQAVDEADYKSEWTLRRKVLWAILATRRVVFLGFSMKDPYLNEMLNAVSTDLWRWDEPIHFTIMDISPQNAESAKHQAEFFRRVRYQRRLLRKP